MLILGIGFDTMFSLVQSMLGHAHIPSFIYSIFFPQITMFLSFIILFFTILFLNHSCLAFTFLFLVLPSLAYIFLCGALLQPLSCSIKLYVNSKEDMAGATCTCIHCHPLYEPTRLLRVASASCRSFCFLPTHHLPCVL